MRLPIYLDYMATTPVDPRVAERMMQCLTLEGNFGNPASRTHAYGWRAETAVEEARQQVADLLNTHPQQIIWTSGGTESNNMAILGAARFYQRQGNHIVTCTTEHKAVLDVCVQLQREGFVVTYLTPDENGLIQLEQLESALRKETLLVSIMHANNEIGVIQNIKAIAELTRMRGILFHVDAAQSAGKIPINLQEIPVDLMSFSAHKIYGPKGIGALYIRNKPRLRLAPLSHGGGHEQGLRPGTLPTHQIVGMGEAFNIAGQEMASEAQRTAQLKQYLWEGLKKVAKIQRNGDEGQCLPGNLNVSFVGIDAQTLLSALPNIAVSSGSACTSGSLESSYVLRAIGVSDALARSALRFSVGRFTTLEEIEFVIAEIGEAVKKQS